jgi:hypothetical protein
MKTSERHKKEEQRGRAELYMEDTPITFKGQMSIKKYRTYHHHHHHHP